MKNVFIGMKTFHIEHFGQPNNNQQFNRFSPLGFLSFFPFICQARLDDDLFSEFNILVIDSFYNLQHL